MMLKIIRSYEKLDILPSIMLGIPIFFKRVKLLVKSAVV